jgi:hypothetical protein
MGKESFGGRGVKRTGRRREGGKKGASVSRKEVRRGGRTVHVRPLSRHPDAHFWGQSNIIIPSYYISRPLLLTHNTNPNPKTLNF